MIPATDLVCFSHLRWGFVYQRPNHLMSRFARRGRVFFVEEPVEDTGPARMEATEISANLWVCTPHLPGGVTHERSELLQRELVDELLREREVTQPVVWFYTPMALPLAIHIRPALVVYDCMDELSGFRGAPPELVERERQLFARADLVFTGGHSLYEAKRKLHPAVFAFPSSVESAHFAQARAEQSDPTDQASIARPRLGFFGVLDERMDLGLLVRLAEERPNYQIVLIGPVVKISEASLPRGANIHYLGAKQYRDLPQYIAGWDVAIMPFALNEATRFISPTKTLEYLAAGKPIVSTAIRDVVSPYGESKLVEIADQSSFAEAIDRALRTDSGQHRERCDQILERTSWDKTWAEMFELITGSVKHDARASAPQKGESTCSII